MTPTESLIQHWWFHLPNLLLAAMIYTVIGRYILELVFGGKDVVIVNVFRSVTDPVIKLVRLITPAVVPNGVVIVFTLMWLMAARMLWFLTAVAAGMSPSVGV
jgi:YggT family protein